MSSITIATLPRISRDALAALLQAGSTPATLAIIDVRDSGMFFCDKMLFVRMLIYLFRPRWWPYPFLNLGPQLLT